MSAYRIVVSKKTYSKTNVGDYVKVGKDDNHSPPFQIPKIISGKFLEGRF